MRTSHFWCRFVAYTFDELTHVVQHGGMHYAMGYCGAGVGTASYFGMRVGQQVLGLPQGRTALDGLAFETRPFYTGNPGSWPLRLPSRSKSGKALVRPSAHGWCGMPCHARR